MGCLNVNFKHVEALPKGKNNCGAYTITHDKTGTQYHGSTKDIRNRKVDHLTHLNNNKHGNEKLQFVAAEDPNFTVRFIPTETVEEARGVEQRLIDETPRDKLLNISLDANNYLVGLWKDPETKKKFCLAKRGNKNAEGSVWTEERRDAARQRMLGNQNLAGHHHSEETRRKMSESGKNKPIRPPESYQRSRETSQKQGETLTRFRVIVDGVEFKNAAEASKFLGVAQTTIQKRCQSEYFPEYKKVPKT